MAITSQKAIVLSDYSYVERNRTTSNSQGGKLTPYDLRKYSYIKLSSTYNNFYAYVNPNALVVIDQSDRSIHCDFFFKVVYNTELIIPDNDTSGWRSVGEDGGWKGVLQFLGGAKALMINEASTSNTIGGQTLDIFTFGILS